MANLKEIAELCWEQLFPRPRTNNAIALESFIATAKKEYAYQLWLKSKADKREEGFFEVPSYLLSEVDKDVVNNRVDISDLGILRSLDNDQWLQSIGGVNCKCRYVKMSLSQYKTLCEDDSLDNDVRVVYVQGNEIIFPQGSHITPIPIIFANNGEKVDDKIVVDDAIGGIIRRSLLEIYGGKIGKEDKTNNENSGT